MRFCLKHLKFAVFAIVSLSPLSALAQFDTDADCGAEGYACLNGRHCSSERCLPAWQDITPVGAPSGAIGGAIESLDGKLAVFGGCDPAQGTGEAPAAAAALYDPATDSWDSFGSPVTGRQYAFSASGNGGIFLFGGLSGCYWPYGLPTDLEFATTLEDWAPLPAESSPSGRYYGSMVWTGTDLFVYGGSDDWMPAKSDGGRYTPGVGWSLFSAEGYQQRGGQYDVVLDTDGVNPVVRVLGGLSGYGNAPQSLTYGLTTDVVSETWSVPEGGPVFDQSICAAGAGGDHDGNGHSYYLGLSGGVWDYDSVLGTWAFDPEWTPSLSVCAPAAWSGGELFAWSGDGSAYGARYQPPAN